MNSSDPYYSPLKTLLLSPSRVGSRWLLSLIDTHPDVFALRSEPLAPHGHWSKWVPHDHERWQLFLALLAQPGFKANVLKISYRAFRIRTATPLEFTDKVIHLSRQNLLRVVVSSQWHTKAVAGELDLPGHTFEEQDTRPVPREVNVRDVVTTITKIKREARQHRGAILGAEKPCLEVVYEDLVDDSEKILAEIFEFLEVDPPPHPPTSIMKRVNPWPLSYLVANWADLEREIAKSWPRYLSMEQADVEAGRYYTP